MESNANACCAPNWRPDDSFLGENAAQLAMMFDDAHYWSKTFRRDMDETSRTHRNIYVGSRLADLEDQPNFGNAGFDPQSKQVNEGPAFGKAAGAETHFIVVKPGSHSLVHGDRLFDGSAQLALVHELLHPSQMIRELADSSFGSDTEHETQRREQRIAVELRKVPGKDFPDVIGSGKSYGVPPNVDQQPNSPPSNASEPVAPIGYHGPAFVQPAQPSWREAGGSFGFPRYTAAGDPAARLTNNLAPTARPDAEGDPNAAESKPVRYLSGGIAGRSAPPFDVGAPAAPLVPSDAPFDDHVGNRIAPAPTGPYRPELPQPAARLPGLVSGEPMDHLLPPSIFGFPETPAPGDEDWLLQLLAQRRGR